MELSWDPPAMELQNGLIRQYGVRIVTLNTQREMIHTTNGTRLLVDGLHPFYIYRCYVLAITLGPGPPTDVVSQLPEDSKYAITSS